jgi:hypothetical protein
LFCQYLPESCLAYLARRIDHLLSESKEGDLPEAQHRATAGMLVVVVILSFVILLLTMRRDLNMFDEGLVLSDAMRVLHGQIVHRCSATTVFGQPGSPPISSPHSPDSGLLWARIARSNVLGNGRSRIACAASGRTS